MRSFGLLLAVISLWPGTKALTSHEFQQMHKRSVDNLAPLYRRDDSSSASSNSTGTAIPHEYIVMFRPGWTLEQHWAAVGGKDTVIDHRDTRFLNASFGYRATIVDDQRMDRIRADPGVLLVENNRHVTLVEPEDEYNHHPGDDEDDAALKDEKLHKLGKREYTTVKEPKAPWGLQLLNGAGKLSTPIKDDGEYEYVFAAGLGVQVYVIDSGIRISHRRFRGHARNFGGLASTDKSPYCSNGATMEDKRGHGTHVAGIIGAEKYGVAPMATLVNVQVWCNGKNDAFQIIRAVNDITDEHIANKKAHGETWKFRGTVINMSLTSGGISYSEVQTYIRAKEEGITVFAAAGNSAKDASNISPCAYPEVRCVSAVDQNYAFAKDYANYGRVVEYLAPGTDVLSLGHASDISLVRKTGTSMASPHAAGAAAIFISWQGLISDYSNPTFYVWSNTLGGLISGVPSGTGSLLINTGIHSPRKYPKEPFRWAGDYPVKNHEANYLVNINPDGSGDPIAGEPLTGDDMFPEYKTMGNVDAAPVTDEGPAPTTSEPDEFPDITPSNGTNGTDGTGQQLIAVASYINPIADPSAWNRLIGYPNSKVPVLVANVVNGPDSAFDKDWKSVIDRAAGAGKIVIGYVRTGYLSLNAAYTPDFLPYKTRLGSTGLSDWVAQIEHDVDAWYDLYPGSMGGIFFDEGWMECGPNNIYADIYKYINDYTKRKHPGAYTVLNPGSPIASCYENTMDTLLTFELSYEAYTSSYKGNDWNSTDPRKIWHIVYNVPASAVDQVAKLAKERGAGIIQITNDIMPNPYDQLPDETYMQSHLSAVSGGLVPYVDAHAWPSSGGAAGAVASLVVAHSDYSSAALNWNAASNVVGYYVYDNGQLIASVPSSMTSITIGGLTPGTAHTFTVAAVGSGGTTGATSPSASITTMSLPDGKSVTSYSSSPSSGSTTIKADILVPYAFLRIYIWDSIECDFQQNPGWPINFKSDQYVCTHYMVEGKTLFKYTGAALPEGSTAAPWTWTNISEVTIDTTGYTYTWTLPIGTSTTDTSKFVVQAQGYGPYINVFSPTPDDYDCKGSGLCGSTSNLLSWCDKAAANITDGATYSSGTSTSGTCSGNSVQACGVFVQKFGGGSCSMSGNELHRAYDNIRKVGGCKKCGSFHRSDGCLATINYVTFCPTDEQGT